MLDKSKILNVDTAALAQNSQGDFFGYVES